MIEKSSGWCCENCGRLIKGNCDNNEGYVLCLKCFQLNKDIEDLKNGNR